MIRIFQIGFHVCGTRSLENFFLRNNFKTFHNYNGKMANQLVENLDKNTDITFFNKELNGPFENFQGVFYSDMEHFNEKRDVNPLNKREGYKLFKEIDKSYPDSLFILNVRDGWVDSKMKKIHKRLAKYNLKYDDVKEYFIKDWNTHLNNVRNYFKDRKNFLEFHIQKDEISKLIDWLTDNNVKVTYKNELKRIRG